MSTVEWSLALNNFGKTTNTTTCCDVSGQFFCRGTKSGTVYIYDQITLSQKVLVSSSEFDKHHPHPIVLVCISPNEQYIAVANSNHGIYVLELGGTTSTKTVKLISSHNEHKIGITAIAWSWDSTKIFSGDIDGCSFEFLVKSGYFQQAIHKFVKEKTEVVQLAFTKDCAVLSGLTRSISINLEEKGLSAIGTAVRDGKFGATFLTTATRGVKVQEGQPIPLSEYIFCSRPQARVWCAEKKTGKVLSTLKFPELTLTNFNFGKILPLGSQLVTWTSEYLTILDLGKLSILDIKSDFRNILDVATWNNVCFVVHGDQDVNISRVILHEEKVPMQSLKVDLVNNLDLKVDVSVSSPWPVVSDVSSPLPQQTPPINQNSTSNQTNSILKSLEKPSLLVDSFFGMFQEKKKDTAPPKKSNDVSTPQTPTSVSNSPILQPISKPEVLVKEEIPTVQEVLKEVVNKEEKVLETTEDVKIVSKKKKPVKKNLVEMTDQPISTKPGEEHREEQVVFDSKQENPDIKPLQPVEPIVTPEVKPIEPQVIQPVVEKKPEVTTPVPQPQTPVMDKKPEFALQKSQKIEDKLVSAIGSTFSTIGSGLGSIFGPDPPIRQPNQQIPREEKQPVKIFSEPIPELEDKVEKKITKKTKTVREIEDAPKKGEEQFTLDISKIKKKPVKKTVKKHVAEIMERVSTPDPDLVKQELIHVIAPHIAPHVEDQEEKPIPPNIEGVIEVKVPILEEKASEELQEPIKEQHIAPKVDKKVEKIETKQESPKQPIPIVPEPKRVEEPEDLTRYEDFIQVTEKVEMLYSQMLEHQKPRDDLWFDDFIPNLELWKNLLIQFIQEKKVPKTIPQLDKMQKLINFWFSWSFKQDEKLAPKLVSVIIQTLFGFLDMNNVISIINDSHYFSLMESIFKCEEENHVFVSERQKIAQLLKENIEIAVKFISQVGFNNHSLLYRYIPELFHKSPDILVNFAVYNYPTIKYWNIQKMLQESPNLYKKYLEKLFLNRAEVINDHNLKIEIFEQFIDDSSSRIPKILLADKSIHADVTQIILKKQKKEFYHIFSQDRIFELILQDLSLLDVFYESNHDLKIWKRLLNHLHSDVKFKDMILHKMCQFLDSTDILNVFNDPSLSLDMNSNLFDKISLLAEMEQKQNVLKHEMLEIIDTYMWGKRDMISPQISGLVNHSKDYKEQLTKFGMNDLNFKYQPLQHYPEEKNHWGLSVDPARKCRVCQLELAEELGTHVRLFPCGHAFHNECIPYEACSICYLKNFSTL